MSEEKRAEFSPRAFLWSEGPEYISLIKIPECEERKRMAWMSVAEHQSLLTAAEEKLRIAREALETAPSLIDDDYVTTETTDGEKEDWINHGALKRHVDEALAKLGGADERS